MHHLTLHITTKKSSNKFLYAVHDVLHKNNYGTVFWSVTEGKKTEMGLVVYKEKKARVKEDVGLVLEKMGVTDYTFVHPINPDRADLRFGSSRGFIRSAHEKRCNARERMVIE